MTTFALAPTSSRLTSPGSSPAPPALLYPSSLINQLSPTNNHNRLSTYVSKPSKKKNQRYTPHTRLQQFLSSLAPLSSLSCSLEQREAAKHRVLLRAAIAEEASGLLVEKALIHPDIDPIHSFIVNRCTINKPALVSILRGLTSHAASLTSLSFIHCEHRVDLAAVCAALHTFTHLHHLSLWNTHLNSLNSAQIRQINSCTHTLHTLNLSSTQINSDALHSLLTLLLIENTQTRLTELDISNNAAPPSIATILATALMSPHCALHILNAQYNQFQVNGILAIAASLQLNIRLTHLDIRWNELQHDNTLPFDALVSAFQVNFSLEELLLCGTAEPFTTNLQAALSLLIDRNRRRKEGHKHTETTAAAGGIESSDMDGHRHRSEGSAASQLQEYVNPLLLNNNQTTTEHASPLLEHGLERTSFSDSAGSAPFAFTLEPVASSSSSSSSSSSKPNSSSPSSPSVRSTSVSSLLSDTNKLSSVVLQQEQEIARQSKIIERLKQMSKKQEALIKAMKGQHKKDRKEQAQTQQQQQQGQLLQLHAANGVDGQVQTNATSVQHQPQQQQQVPPSPSPLSPASVACVSPSSSPLSPSALPEASPRSSFSLADSTAHAVPSSLLDGPVPIIERDTKQGHARVGMIQELKEAIAKKAATEQESQADSNNKTDTTTHSTVPTTVPDTEGDYGTSHHSRTTSQRYREEEERVARLVKDLSDLRLHNAQLMQQLSTYQLPNPSTLLKRDSITHYQLLLLQQKQEYERLLQDKDERIQALLSAQRVTAEKHEVKVTMMMREWREREKEGIIEKQWLNEDIERLRKRLNRVSTENSRRTSVMHTQPQQPQPLLPSASSSARRQTSPLPTHSGSVLMSGMDKREHPVTEGELVLGGGRGSIITSIQHESSDDDDDEDEDEDEETDSAVPESSSASTHNAMTSSSSSSAFPPSQHYPFSSTQPLPSAALSIGNSGAALHPPPLSPHPAHSPVSLAPAAHKLGSVIAERIHAFESRNAAESEKIRERIGMSKMLKIQTNHHNAHNNTTATTNTTTASHASGSAGGNVVIVTSDNTNEQSVAKNEVDRKGEREEEKVQS